MGCFSHLLELSSFTSFITSPPSDSMRDMKKIECAYLAGVLDSDGTIGIKKNTYSMRVTGDSTQATYSERVHIRQVTAEALDLFVELFGGNLGKSKASAPNGRDLFAWGVTDRKAIVVLKALLPFLRIKRSQALNCMALRALKTTSAKERVAKGRGHVGASVRTTDMTNRMEARYQQAKVLNHVGL